MPARKFTLLKISLYAILLFDAIILTAIVLQTYSQGFENIGRNDAPVYIILVTILIPTICVQVFHMRMLRTAILKQKILYHIFMALQAIIAVSFILMGYTIMDQFGHTSNKQMKTRILFTLSVYGLYSIFLLLNVITGYRLFNYTKRKNLQTEDDMIGQLGT